MTWNTDMAGLAERHVERFGRSCTYTVRTKGAINTTTGVRAETTTTATISMVQTMRSTMEDLGGRTARRIDSCTFSIATADLAAAAITPDTNDTITDAASVRWSVAEINKRMDGTLTVLSCRKVST